MRTMVTGASGMVGRAVLVEARARGWDAIGWSRSVSLAPDGTEFRVADLTVEGSVTTVVDESAPDLIVNCAAQTSPIASNEETMRTNARLPEQIARVAERRGIRLVHVSSEGVYDGVRSGKRGEEEPTRPANAYGRSKLEGERRVLVACPDALIARISVFGWTIPGELPKRAEKILAGLIHGRELKLPVEVTFSPLHAGLLAVALLDLAERPEIAGILNVGARDGISMPDFARAIAEAFRLRSRLVVDASLEESDGFFVPWPKNIALNVERVEGMLGRMPSVADGVARLYREAWDGTATKIRGRETYP